MIDALSTLRRSTTPTLDTATTLDLLANQRRRYAVAHLSRNAPTRLPDLAEHITALETGAPIDDLPSDKRKAVYQALSESHLGRLENADAVVYEPEGRVINRGPTLDHLATVLESIRDQCGDSE